MKTRLLPTAALALAGAMLLAPVARATTLAYSAGDLILGFRAFSGTGATTDYEVNLGSGSLFLSGGGQASALHTISLGNLGADLTSIFGASWNTRSDVFWGIAGATQNSVSNGIPKQTLFASKAETTLGQSSVAWVAAGAGTQAVPSGLINGGLGSGVQGYNKGDTISGNTISSNVTGGLIQATSGGNSYASYMSSNGSGVVTSAFGYFSGGIEGNFGAGTAGSVLDLFELTTANSGNAGTLVGGFQLDNSGVLSFSNNVGDFAVGAVPEPSTYAALFGAAVMGFAVWRRRKAVGSA
jgi:hypothetical protein